MATYYGTYGQKVQYLASDPSDPQIGQVWYNSTSAVLKVRQLGTVNAFSAGGNLNTGRLGLAGANSGTQTATIVFGGNPGPGAGPTFVNATESYNGTSWTTLPATMNTARNYLSGCGTQTSALAFSGLTTTPAPSGVSVLSESYNGTSWTNTPTMNTSGQQRFGVGASNTSALCFLGSGPLNAFGLDNTESWNGSSWTSLANANTGRSGGGSAGVQGAALGFGGYRGGSGLLTATESWNGTSWTTVNAMNNVRGSAGFGSQTAAVVAGGAPPGVGAGATELWNGTSWTNNPTGLLTARQAGTGTGTQTLGLISGGGSGSNSTEEWSGIVAQNKTVTVS